MTLSAWLYIVDVLNSINNMAVIFFIVSGVGLFAFGFASTATIYSSEDWIEWRKKVKKYSKLIWIPILSLLFFVFLPSEKTMYLMLGSSYLSSTGIPTKVQKALELKLDDVIKDLSKKDEKK